MARATIVPEFPVPFWGVADMSAWLLEIDSGEASGTADTETTLKT